MRRYRVVTAVVIVAGLGLLSGCSGSNSTKSASGAGLVHASDAAGAAAEPAAARAPAAQVARSVVVTATVSLVAARVDAVADRVDALAARGGGRVDGDRRSSAGSDRTATLTLRVPGTRVDPLIAAVDQLGTETGRSVKRDDVTTAKADVDARVATLATSVTRLRHLLGTAAGVGTLLQVEKVLTAREADLSSLRASQRALNDQIDLATITVTITTKAAAAVHRHFHATGFLAAVGSSIHGIGVTVTVIIAVLGYVLPVAVPIGLVTAAGFALRRRRRSPAGPVDGPATT